MSNLTRSRSFMTSPAVSYKRHRFPSQIIAHAVWLYFRFPLSLRLVEEMLLEQGMVVSYETVRCWAIKFGPDYARRLKRKTPSHRDVWYLDEVVITINGESVGCGAPSIRRATFSTKSFKAAAIRRPPNAC
jgi:transposase-like protein